MRMKRSFRAWVPSLVASTALIAPLGLPASPDVLANAIIPVEDAVVAFYELSTWTHWSIFFDAEAVEGVRTRKPDRNLEPRRALEEMLEGTGLGYAFINATTVSIFLKRSKSAATSTAKQAPRSVIVVTTDKTDRIGLDGLHLPATDLAQAGYDTPQDA